MMQNGKTPMSIKLLSYISCIFGIFAYCTQKVCKKQKICGANFLDQHFFLGVTHVPPSTSDPNAVLSGSRLSRTWSTMKHLSFRNEAGSQWHWACHACPTIRGNHVESYMVANELKQRPSCTFVSRWVAFGHGHRELWGKPAPQLREKRLCSFSTGQPNTSEWLNVCVSLVFHHKHCFQTPACRSRPNTVTLPLPERTPCRWPACKMGYGSYGT